MKLAGPIPLVLACALSVLAGTACPPDPHVRPDGDAHIAGADELLAAMRRSRPDSLRVSGTVDMRRAGKRVKAHMLYLTRRPAWLRFETESFFDQPLSILVSDGMTFAAWDMNAGRFVRGRATPANISQIIPVPMDGPEVAGILMGDPPLIPYARAELSWDEDRGLYRLELSNARLTQSILVEPGSLRPVEVRLHRGRDLFYRLEFSDWIRKDGRPVAPSRIRFEMPSEEIKLRIRIREVEADCELADDLFRLDPPEGVPVEVWK